MARELGTPAPSFDDTGFDGDRLPAPRPSTPEQSETDPVSAVELTGWECGVLDAETEAALVRRSGKGNLHAMTNLYELHWSAGVSFAYSLTRHHVDAEEMAALAFLKVMSALKSGKGPTGPFRPYLFRAIRTCVADHWRQRSYEYVVGNIPETSEEDPGYARIDAATDRELATKALASLPLRWQKVLWQVEVVGLRPRQVAPILGIEPNAVSALAKRARRGLREAYLVEYIRSTAPDECHELLPLLARSAMDTASPRDTATVSKHTRSCADCRRALGRLHDVQSTMRAALTPVALTTVVHSHLAACTHASCTAVHDFLQSPFIIKVLKNIDATLKHKFSVIKALALLAGNVARFFSARIGITP